MERRVNNLAGIPDALGLLGWCARMQGDFRRARSYYLDCLLLTKQFDNFGDTVACILDIGILFGKEGDPEKFSRLWGAAQGIIPYILDTLIQLSKIETRQSIEDAQAALGKEAYTAAYEMGKQMSLDEAISYCLKELQ